MATAGHDLAPSDAARAGISPLSVELLGTGEEREWDDYVRGAPRGTFFHLAGWRRVIECAFGHATYYLLARQAGGIVGVLPLTHLKSRIFGNALIANGFCVYGGPLVGSEAALSALDAEAIRIMQRLGARYLEYRTISPLHQDWPRKGELYVTFRRPLAPTSEANLKAIPRKQRAMVRKGIALGLRSEIDDDVGRLHHVYAESVRNLGTPVFSKAYFRILKEEFQDSAEIVTVLHGRTVLASVLNFYFKDEVLPYYGGGTAAARMFAANDFMYWEVMRRAAERGSRVFDFGRSKVGTGSYDFKRFWGFTPTPLVYEYRLSGGAQIPDINPLNPKYRLFAEAWRRMPLALSKLLGPMIVRNIG